MHPDPQHWWFHSSFLLKSFHRATMVRSSWSFWPYWNQTVVYQLFWTFTNMKFSVRNIWQVESRVGPHIDFRNQNLTGYLIGYLSHLLNSFLVIILILLQLTNKTFTQIQIITRRQATDFIDTAIGTYLRNQNFFNIQ